MKSFWQTLWRKDCGSTSVFLVMILASLLTATIVFIRASDRQVDAAYCDSVFFLAGRSVLAGYDLELKEEYGLIAYYGTEKEVRDRIEKYAAPTFTVNPTLTVADLSVSLQDHSLLNPDLFQREVSDYTKYALAKSLLLDRDPGSPASKLTLGSEKTLRNEGVLKSLPSYGLGTGGGLWQAVKNAFTNIDQVFQKGADNVLTEVYIMGQFKNAQDDIEGKDTFFRYEAEYILNGAPSDKENYEAFRDDLLLLRNAVNITFLYTDPTKRNELLAVAELMAPGPGAIALQLVLAEIWALAEAENDVALLEHGKKVPLFKDQRSWATDLDSILEMDGDGYIDVDNETGFVYRDYLRMFLFVMDGRTKLLRMMDLIQINMQGAHDGAFYIRNHYVGLDFFTKVNGRAYHYGHGY